MTVEEFPKRRRCPGGSVNPVGDGLDGIPGEHQARDLSVSPGDSVYEAAHVEAEIRHVERMPFVEHALKSEKILAIPDDLAGEIDRKLVVAGWNRRVGGEDTPVPHPIYVLWGYRFPACSPGRLIEKFERQQGSMAFVHMETAHIVIAESAQHPDSADAGFCFRFVCRPVEHTLFARWPRQVLRFPELTRKRLLLAKGSSNLSPTRNGSRPVLRTDGFDIPAVAFP